MEFAFVAPILIMLVFGIADFGLTYNNYISLRQGARDGARQAAVANFGSSTSCALTPLPTNAAAQQLMCLTKDRIDLNEANTRVKIVATSGYSVGDTVVVCAQYPLSSASGVFGALLNGRVITTKVKMRAEQLSSLAGAEETAPSGGNWSWCS